MYTRFRIEDNDFAIAMTSFVCITDSPVSPAMDVDICGNAIVAYRDPATHRLHLLKFGSSGLPLTEDYAWDPGSYPSLAMMSGLGVVSNNLGEVFEFIGSDLSYVNDYEPNPGVDMGPYPSACYWFTSLEFVPPEWWPKHVPYFISMGLNSNHEIAQQRIWLKSGDAFGFENTYTFDTDTVDGFPSVARKNSDSTYYYAYRDVTTKHIRWRKGSWSFEPSSGEGYSIFYIPGTGPGADVQAGYGGGEHRFVTWAQQWGLNQWVVYASGQEGPGEEDWYAPITVSSPNPNYISRYPHAALSHYYKRGIVMWTQVNGAETTLEFKAYRMVDITPETLLVVTPYPGDEWEQNTSRTVHWQLKDYLTPTKTKVQVKVDGFWHNILNVQDYPCDTFAWLVGTDIYPPLDDDETYHNCLIRVLLKIEGCPGIDGGPYSHIDTSGYFSIIPYTGQRSPESDITEPETAEAASFSLFKPEITNSGVTTIRFCVPRAVTAHLDVYNITGQKITTLLDGSVEAGEHELTWEGVDNAGRQVSAGVYFIRMQAEGFQASEKITLIR